MRIFKNHNKGIIEGIKFVNQYLSISNVYVTGDLYSPKWCIKCKLYPKVWLEYGHKVGDDWSIKSWRLISESYSTVSTRFNVKEAPI